LLGKLKYLAAASLIALVALAGAGCGDDSQADSAQSAPLIVSAASSLNATFGEYANEFEGAKVKTSFAGSDELAAQIERGVRPDVLAAANMKIPDALYAKGLVEKPVTFAGNRLVIAVPADAAKVKSLDDLQDDGVTIAAGSESVPIGSYTRKVLGGLPASEQKAILANFRSNEPDVKGVVGKLAAGAVDAGFVYVTDVTASGGKLKAIELPEKLQPSVAYGAAVVKGAKNPEQAQAFIDGLLSGDGAEALKKAGFEPPPS
jgi:molybdate transport system substrate-binding protein